jgi:hypothetical protein
MPKIILIIEKTEHGYLGRVDFKNNLILTEENSLSKVEAKIKVLLRKYHGIENSAIQLQHKYDLTSLFDKFDYLKISNIAKLAGVNDSLLRQYVIGNKHASQNQAKKIESAIHKIGKDLMTVQVYGNL